ncbi:L-fucose/L-arabinose isomerase family protein [Testudinibacter sp. TR-2022]|uniref:L-fucose/L-arabinose isomerase family protein n=1 Tax=Testudinibacter sp. TR-2022 TaxID=2585029 RepID=UPI00111A2825|nr:L-fucose/L-arabinose isomerase family protein [Testudinibacter sp. TR-2022]TNH07842.1 fucose isomerase [Pasteurellaceae bacterium Phil11]TNH24632.1 fucose isomerase [Testudinibacter sp. TR-2022]TNH28120.1 fucose isomerase [Testudinibacter sp. TR-2022]
MKKSLDKMTLAVLIGNRGFFPSYLVGDAKREAVRIFDELGINTVMLTEEQTNYGGIETYQDAKIAAQMLKQHRDEIAGIVILLPNFGDEKALSQAIRLSGLNVPVLVQAEDDNLDKMGLATRRDSFCGKISLCNNLRQFDIPFTLTTQHTCALSSDIFKQDLLSFVSVCRVVKALRGCRVGAIGARPAGFNTVRYSEKLLERLGISVETIDLSEIFAGVNRLRDDDLRIAEKLELLKANADASAIPQEKLHMMAKLFVVISNWIIENGIDTTAIQCWTSLQDTLGINVCSIMSVMSGQLMPSACEVDVMGALSMYALSIASMKPASIADWNNNFGEERDKCVMFHCGNYATEELDNPFMSTADIIGTTVGCENTCGAINGRMKAGPLTYFRLSTDDFSGKVKAYVGEGKFVDDELETVGCRAVIQVKGLEELLAYICNNGFEHHVAMNHSSSAKVLYEVFTKYLGVECYYHK